MSSLSAAGQAFIREELDDWAPFLVERLRSQIRARNIREDDALLGSVVAEVLNGTEVDLSFLRHGRWHDMGAGRYYHKGQFTGDKQRRRGKALKGRKPSKFYSRTAWGAMTTLVNNLQQRYVAGIPAGIKNILTDGQTA